MLRPRLGVGPIGVREMRSPSESAIISATATVWAARSRDTERMGLPMPLHSTPQQRFWSKVRRDQFGCLVWRGAMASNGYGHFRLKDKVWQAHRLAWEWAHGPVPDGLTLDHLCRNRACVKVQHLELVTMRENILRGNGRAAHHARKTHCLHGHPFDDANTYVRYWGKRTERACRICGRIRNRLQRQKAKLTHITKEIPDSHTGQRSNRGGP